MGKTRDFLKKIRDTKGIFHAKMGTIKDRNGMNLTEADNIKKKWQEYTEELCKSQGSRGLGRGDHFLSYKFIKRTIEHSKFHKTTSDR